MKNLILTILASAVILIIGAMNAMATEEASYKVLKTSGKFEIREYAPHILAETVVDGDLEEAGNKAFRRLFNYISGANQSRAKVAMTAPVSQEKAGEKISMTAPVVQRAKGDRDYVIAFVLPAALTADTAPAPTNPDVELCTIPTSLTAAKEYGGRWSQSSYERHCAELLDAVATAGLRPVGAPRFARFDPPFKPWFLRRNEVLVDVEEASTPTA